MPDRIASNILEVQSALRRLSSKFPLRAVLLSPQKRTFCTDECRAAAIAGVEFDVLPDIPDALRRAGEYDFCILCCHNEGEEAILLDLRNRGLARFYAVWLWDNHHHHILNLRTAVLADIVFLSHWHRRHYLNHPLVLPGPHIALHSRQWSPALIDRLYPEGLPAERQDGLFGGFGRYQWVPQRNEFIEQLAAQTSRHALTLGDVEAYLRLPAPERLRRWVEHKVQLVVPIEGDVSNRVFEALMTGQIPLVPTDVVDLDRVVAPDLQAALPILRYQPYSVAGAQVVWREGVRRFDAEGTAGVARRHRYARDHHSLSARLKDFAAFLRQPGEFALASDGRMVRWQNWN
jgi:hypothetical protein